MEKLYLLIIGALSALIVILIIAIVKRRASASGTDDVAAALKSGIDAVISELRRVEAELKTETNNRLEAVRMAVDNRLDRLSESTSQKFGESSDRQNAAAAETRKTLDARIEKLTETLDGKLDRTRVELTAAAAETRKTLDARLEGIIAKNDEKLEQMRLTVDEKLQSTLEKRLSESFKLVGDNLDKVIQSMGEMRAVAADVGDLKRVLTNVKNRGTWGEYQLALILETLLQPDQYEANVKPRPRSDNIVEFAVKLPGRDADGKPVWLPIDSKFPKEDYERLADAAARADAEGVETAARALAANIESSAREIRDKYIAPPHTTDFGILFLPTEGLYAETLRRPGLVDKIQRECRVLIAGPTTLAALLNSLQMGFRTLAIEKRSSEVWKMLGAIKTQFGKFGDTLENVQKKLDAAGREISEASQRHRVITGRLARVEELPASEAAQLLPENSADNV
ncbi:MAG: DNA recombination protein RmuC [Acidobacteriota bacterium]|jgi:DNA recombination protein RmuC|nr:DNA recombination protein RmuC [Acidobacteriota bacterium]